MLKPGTNDSYRMPVGLKPINYSTLKEVWPMPHLDSEVSYFKYSKTFCKMCFVVTYWQLGLHEESKELFGIVLSKEEVISERILQGLTNAIFHFQSSVEPLFAKIRKHLKAFLDDFSLHHENEYDL